MDNNVQRLFSIQVKIVKVAGAHFLETMDLSAGSPNDYLCKISVRRLPRIFYCLLLDDRFIHVQFSKLI